MLLVPIWGNKIKKKKRRGQWVTRGLTSTAPDSSIVKPRQLSLLFLSKLNGGRRFDRAISNLDTTIYAHSSSPFPLNLTCPRASFPGILPAQELDRYNMRLNNRNFPRTQEKYAESNMSTLPRLYSLLLVGKSRPHCLRLSRWPSPARL